MLHGLFIKKNNILIRNIVKNNEFEGTILSDTFWLGFYVTHIRDLRQPKSWSSSSPNMLQIFFLCIISLSLVESSLSLEIRWSLIHLSYQFISRDFTFVQLPMCINIVTVHFCYLWKTNTVSIKKNSFKVLLNFFRKVVALNINFKFSCFHFLRC